MTASNVSSRTQGLAGTARFSLLMFSACVLLANPLTVRAGDINPKAIAAAQSTEKKNAPNTSEVALKEMRDELRRLHRASLDLISEVEQRDMVVVGEPLLIEPIPEKKNPHPGTMEEMVTLGDALPPRKKWLDLTMAEIEKLASLIAEERALIVIPPDQKSAIDASVKELDDRLADIQKHVSTLKALTAGPKYDNIAIGKEALGLYQDTEKFEKPWKEILNGVRSRT